MKSWSVPVSIEKQYIRLVSSIPHESTVQNSTIYLCCCSLYIVCLIPIPHSQYPLLWILGFLSSSDNSLPLLMLPCQHLCLRQVYLPLVLHIFLHPYRYQNLAHYTICHLICHFLLHYLMVHQFLLCLLFLHQCQLMILAILLPIIFLSLMSTIFLNFL